MTREEREEAIAILEEVRVIDDSMFQFNSAYLKALDTAIEALKAEPCGDCISREALTGLKYDIYKALCKEIHKTEECPCTNQTTSCWATFRVCDANSAIGRTIDRYIQELPSVNSERPKGEWKEFEYEGGIFCECSCCEETEIVKTPFCPYCGADMRGAQK